MKRALALGFMLLATAVGATQLKLARNTDADAGFSLVSKTERIRDRNEDFPAYTRDSDDRANSVINRGQTDDSTAGQTRTTAVSTFENSSDNHQETRITLTDSRSRVASEEIREGTWRAKTAMTWSQDGRLKTSTDEFFSPPRGWTYATTHNWVTNTDIINHSWSGDFTDTLSEQVRVDEQGLPHLRTRGALTETWNYDAAGRVLNQAPAGSAATSYTYGSDGRVSVATFAGEQTMYGYDIRGRLHTLQTPGTPSPRTLTREYGDPRGLLTRETFGRGADVHRLDFAYDTAGKLLSRTEALGTGDVAVTGFNYGPRGELLQVTQNEPGSVWNYDYDGLGRLAAVTPPVVPLPAGLRRQTWQYDGLDRVKRHMVGTQAWATDWVDGRSTITSPAPALERIERLTDSRGRLLREAVVARTESVASASVRTFIYDGLNSLRQMQEDTRAPSLYQYDSSHRLERVERGADVVTYGFESSSARVNSVTKGTANFSYGYDFATNRLNLVTGGPNTNPMSVTWEPGGARLDSLNDGTTYEKFGFDARGRLETIDSAPALNTNRRKYTFDERGNPLSETFAGATRHFGYDKADRLTSSTDWAGIETLLTLHPDGTRKLETVGGVQRAYVYSGTTGALRSVMQAGIPIASWQHLTDGRVSSRTVNGVTTELDWDAYGTMVGARVPGVTDAAYEYDGLGLRRKAIVNGVVRTWTWVGETQVAEGNELLASIGPYLIAQGDVRFEHDALGSIVAQRRLVPPPPPPLAPLPPVTSTAQYGTWGALTGGGQLTSNAYTGHRREEALDLTQAEQRWLDNDFGVFLSRDSIGASSYLSSPNGLCPWSYANLSPLRYTDPDGRDPAVIPSGGLDPGQRAALWGAVQGSGTHPNILGEIDSEDDDALTDAYEKYVLGDLYGTQARTGAVSFIHANSETKWQWTKRRVATSPVGKGVEAYEAGWDSARQGACELASGATQNAIDGAPGLGNQFGKGLGGGACVLAEQGVNAVKSRVDAAIVGGVATGVATGIKGTATLAKKGAKAIKEYSASLPNLPPAKMRNTGAIRISPKGPALLGKPGIFRGKRISAKNPDYGSGLGRRGTWETRQDIDTVRDAFLRNNPGYRHVAGGTEAATGRKVKEEFLSGKQKGLKNAYPDLTFESLDGTNRIRINTADTDMMGKLTPDEKTAFDRIFELTGEPILAIPKPSSR